MAEYIAKKDFKINVYDDAGKLTTQVKTIAAGTKFAMTTKPRRIQGKLFVCRLENDDAWIDVTSETLKKSFRKIPKPHPEPEHGTFGENVRFLRQSHGLTQAKLAEKIYLSERMIQTVELNKCSPSAATILAYADYFDVSVDWLLCRDPKYYGGKKNG